MGGLLSVGSLAAFCGSALCSASCAVCNSCAGATMSKLMYTSILLVTVVASCLMLTPGIQDILTKVPFCEESTSIIGKAAEFFPGAANIKLKCADAIGYLAVYRLCFVVTLFFALMALIMCNVRTSRDPRAGLQNGFWGLKYLLVIGGVVGAFFIPHGSFGPVWMYFGLVGGFAFILVQLVLIVDFAHSWAEGWQRQFQQTENQNWFYALLGCTLVFFGICFGLIVFMYSYYTGSYTGQCKLHEFFISFNMILCVILSVASVLPMIQEHQPNSGLLQSSFVSLYIMYLTWSAMTNQPDMMCKPNLEDLLLGRTSSANETTAVQVSDDVHHPSMDTASVFGLILWFVCVLYSSIRSSSNSQAARLSMNDKITLTEAEEGGRAGGAQVEASYDEDNGVSYNWFYFHIMFMLATLYVQMCLTNWYSPGKDVTIESINANMSAVWVKILSAWMCFAIYVWTLVAPVLLPDRDFSV